MTVSRMHRSAVLLRNLAIMFLPWALLILLLSVLLYERLLDGRLAPLLRDQQASITEGLGALNRRLSSVRGNLLFLTQQPLLAQMLERSGEAQRQQLVELFTEFSASTRDYDQIRWLDELGQERVRVDLRDQKVYQVPVAELQNKADRYYFTESMQLPAGAFYLSRFDLNQERGGVEQPLKPMLRAAMPVFDSAGKRRGVVVLNYLGKILLDRLQQVADAYGDSLSLVDHEGFWMLTSHSAGAWGFMLGKPDATLASRYPLSWERMGEESSGHFSDDAGIWSFAHFDPALSADNEEGAKGVADSWMLVSLLPQESVSDTEREVLWRVLLCAGLMLAAGLAVVLRLSQAESARDRARRGLERRGEELAFSNDELQNTLEQLRRTQSALIQAEKLSSLGLLVAGVAHELNTPIGAASMAASTLQKSDEQLRQALQGGLQRSILERYMQRNAEGLEIVLGNLARMAQLTRAFKQLASDRASTERRQFDLVKLVHEVMLIFAPRLKQVPHRVCLELPECMILDSYPGPVGQILQNLIENALLHAFQVGMHGVITVRADFDSLRRLCRVEVKDNGCGMNEDVLARIFDPFFTTRRGLGGTGLGLHITHQLAVDILGAKLQVNSQLGQGTQFLLWLPQA
ncbi:C4-dicarboxylate-specific signal transduction histidine kinase [Pseudomonas sp. SJZ079]|uniref:sensor histidine kinase n=1 Tax=Pseudomonas sp. SJZ079 TaxID=2572887 RepID=UPI00119C26D6|nr:ATP-binding protein [Pseudomonas sp. SJZ079]TWC35605.1 C4-dicarboxylate-specific signal transduction histidine kinase [Pseudomonas sp. SJZ079]